LGEKISSETELLCRAVAGEDLALRQLLLPHLAYSSRMIADKYPNLNQHMSGVDDIIQETFTEAHRQLKQFDPEKGSLRTWLATIANRRVMHVLRDAKQIKRGGRFKRVGHVVGEESSFHDLAEMLSAGGHTASRSAMRHEAVQAIQDVIAQLPDEYQQAVQLYLIDGKSLQEAATVMGRSAPSVQGLIDRAKKKMRVALGRLSRYE
jgi:RNA polymerase sigma-70 factor (ECF subfamily)